MAATEKVAVCPAVTVWVAGCIVTIGATWAELFAPETIPEHPEPASASATTNKIKPQRFIVRLFRETCPGVRLAGRRGISRRAASKVL